MAKAKETTALGKFEGKDVLSTTVKITKAGDGLSKALNIDPEPLHSGDVVYIVLKGSVTDIGFKPIKDTNGVARQHTIEASTVTMVEAALVTEVLDAQEAAIEAASGVQRLPFGGDDDPVALIDAVGMDPEKATAAQLRGWLKDHDLPATGSKPEMVGRVNQWWVDRKAENEGTHSASDDSE